MVRKLIVILLLLVAVKAGATHLRGGQITIRQVSCGSLEYVITVTLYTNTAATAQPGGRGSILSFGDGTFVNVPTLTATVIDATYSVGKAQYSITHRFPSAGTYRLNYTERNRNAGILNIPNSVETPFSIDSEEIINPNRCNNPMTFSIDPIDRACSGSTFTHNPGAKDPDGDSLSYQITVPEQSSGSSVDGYRSVISSSFYTSGSYQTSNEEKNGPPTLTIDSSDGTLTWDAPGTVGEYVIAIKVTEWKKIDTTWVFMGYVIRDMQIIVEDCPDNKPLLDIPQDICVHPGDALEEVIRASDPDNDPVKIEVFADDNYESSIPTFTNNGVYQSTEAPADTANMKMKWTITCDQVRDQPYQFIFKATDKPAQGAHLSVYKTWNVSVVGRPPKFKDITLNLAKKTMQIVWEPYECAGTKMQVWRRVDRFNATPTECQRGIPRSWGFVKIATVSDTSYIDTDISAGATYCYRLVAQFTSPWSSLSTVSKDTCIGPIVVDAPVITRVSVQKTDSLQGAIEVKWSSPFEINMADFPKPYRYALYRTSDGVSYVSVANVEADTTFTDTNLDTRSKLYGYRVVLYAPQGISKENPVDTSALAFYPRLVAEAQASGIQLYWDANVPWSNQSEKFPYHYIYRKEDGSAFALIDSLNVKELTIDSGFVYIDKGTYQNQALDVNRFYTYRVETSGTYGNPKLPEPLLNFSNEVRLQPIDKSPPCAVVLSIEAQDCASFITSYACNLKAFGNSLNWQYAEDCGDDVAFYKIYFFISDTDSVVVGTSFTQSFKHNLSDTFVGCYKVTAVDFSGNESTVSNQVCNDNCPNIFLPNVITVNKDGRNESFPGLEEARQADDLSKCPRFVDYLNIRIFDRWGKEVYTMNADTQSLVEWKGLDNQGRELSTGVYYYQADIYFNTSDTHKKQQQYKGWVSLVR